MTARTWPLVFLACLYLPCGATPQCGSGSAIDPSKGLVRQYRGAYTNFSYGFALIVPKGLMGFDPADPDYQRGFVINLDKGKALLTVSAEVNSMDLDSVKAAAEHELESAKRIGRTIVAVDSHPDTLAGQPAQLLRIRYSCAGRNEKYLSVETISLGRDRDYLYKITWDGNPDLFESTSATVAQIKKTWRFVKVR